MAGIGLSEIQVYWNQHSRGVTQTRNSGDTFPVGETTVVTYSKGDKDVCNFTVTVIPEGRIMYQYIKYSEKA